MKRIKDKIKQITCRHEFERTVFYHGSKKEIKKCPKCDKKIEKQH